MTSFEECIIWTLLQKCVCKVSKLGTVTSSFWIKKFSENLKTYTAGQKKSKKDIIS